MTAELTAKDRILDVLKDVAGDDQQIPLDLIVRIYEHEHAVQFDEKRFEASTYIRGLVNEYLGMDGDQDAH
jgi:hypothetical protein